MKFLTKFFKKFLVLSLLCSSFSCSQRISTDPLKKLSRLDPLDTEAELTRGDFENFLTKDHKQEKKGKDEKLQNEAPIPRISKMITTPPPPVIGGDKIISFSVTDQTPIKDVLIELGRAAKIDIDLDASITGGIVINARNRPFKEVIDRIATLGKLRYSYKNNVLYFERDTPYSKNYFVDFLAGGGLLDDVKTAISEIITNKSTSTDASKSDPTSTVSVNKSAGIISVFATRAQHESINNYLNDVYKIASAQVLIEAKVVEVTLNKDFQAGIDWTWLEAGKSITAGGNTAVSSATFTAVIPKVKLLGLGGNINATIKALETFGTARAVSSPRISALNNQKATLDFSQKLIYFTVNSTQGTTVATSSTTTSTLTTTKFEESVGVQLSITPSINIRTNEITMEIKPKLSVDSGEKASDPSINPTTGLSLGNKIPIIKTRTLDTIAKVQSGSVLVVGGLMSETASNTESGVPFLSRIPFLGYLFKYSSKSNDIIETVIFIKATIVNNGSGPNKYDRDFYNKFTVDRKPF